jgi:SAM-dependent methyltransferase
MRVSYFRALAVLHNAFSVRPIPARAHVLIRFLTCPFLRALRHVRPGFRILDVGAGHGTFARLAIEAGAAEVIAVEPDLRKLFPVLRDPKIHWVAAFDDAVRGEFDLVAIFDVLYRIPFDQWDGILSRAFSRLRPGGTLLIKELDPDDKIKFGWNRIQEHLNDQFLGVTLGPGFNYETLEAFRQRLERAGFSSIEVEDIGAGYPHSHVVVLARKGT